MIKLKLSAFVALALLSLNSFGEDTPVAPKRYGQGAGRPSEAQIAEWRAKRAAASEQPARGGAADMAGMPGMGAMPGMSGMMGAPDKPKEYGARSGRPKEEGASKGGRPGGMGMRGGALWLSETPPMRGDGARSGSSRGGMGGMGGMQMGGERGGVAKKRLWLRAGSDPQKSGFAQDDAEAEVATLLVTPNGNPEGEALPAADDSHKGLSFEMPVQGFYRLYLTSRKLQGDTLNVAVAKAEIANIGHGGDEEEINKALVAQRVLESAPIEIVRERKPDEKRFFQLKSGEEQAFIVLQKGLPVQGARVRFVSYQGWSKEAVSDEQGRVSFQIIRDYFPPWNEFEKRFKATYLLIADVTVAEAGTFKEQPYSNVRYQTTLTGNYYPSPDDYASYAWGLGIGTLILLFSGTAVYLYRRRRVQPYREVRFDDAK
ncbi:MAG: hypothetical protein PHQ60_06800 [Sideroxydans sp.]|nr:hypothetical protein [Sideroxydans sp.]